MRLILMRHAKSDWSAAIPDHDRPLNSRGRASAAAMGNWLRNKGYLPDQVLCSSAERTRETLDLLALPGGVTRRFLETLYLAPAGVMARELAKADAPCVLMLGHNPGIAELAAGLLVRAPDHNRFHDYPTCATLVADFDASQWADIAQHGGVARDFAIPREVIANSNG